MADNNQPVPNNAAYGRPQAWQLLMQWTQGESLRKHALTVEACLAACGEAEAGRLGLSAPERAAMVELYATTALLHDFDYERHPALEEHPFVGVRELERLGWQSSCAPRSSATHSIRVCLALLTWIRRCLPATNWPGF